MIESSRTFFAWELSLERPSAGIAPERTQRISVAEIAQVLRSPSASIADLQGLKS